MSEKPWVVAVDVGNTAVKLCINDNATDTDTELNVHVIKLDDANWPSSAIEWVHHQRVDDQRVDDQRGQTQHRQQRGGRSLQWRIASVNGNAADELEAAIKNASGKKASGKQESGETEAIETSQCVRRVTYRDVPMSVRVDQPARLGIDRLIGAYAASNRYQGPFVVVDAGSAVTVDWVDADNVFCGGAILPGLRLQTESLAAGTDALPQIDWAEAKNICAPGSNTVDAINLGVVTAVAAGVDRLAARYIQQFKQTHYFQQEQNFYIFLTGGDSQILSHHLYSEHVVIPNLVCQGLCRSACVERTLDVRERFLIAELSRL